MLICVCLHYAYSIYERDAMIALMVFVGHDGLVLRFAYAGAKRRGCE